MALTTILLNSEYIYNCLLDNSPWDGSNHVKLNMPMAASYYSKASAKSYLCREAFLGH